MRKAMTLAALAATTMIAAPATAQEKDSFRVAWSIYVGWMPWGYLEESGIMDAWPRNTASTSRSCRSTTMSRASTNTPPAPSTGSA